MRPPEPESGARRLVALAVVVGARDVPSELADLAHGSRAREVRLVQALLAGSPGQAVEVPHADACLLFEDRHAALESATSLVTQLGRLTGALAGIGVQIGLELGERRQNVDVARQAAKIARSSAPDEIRLGEALALLVRRDPPDRMVVERVDASPVPAKVSVYRLTRAGDLVPNNLGRALSSFVGREIEITKITRGLDEGQLVTISGPPGTGKSRLAIEIAQRLLGRYDGGAWFVALAPIVDPGLVIATVADVLSVPTRPGVLPIDALSAYLSSRRTLLVLDNFEHLTEAVPELGDLLAVAPDLHVLVTTRKALRLVGEQEIVLAPLAVPAAGTAVVAPGRSAAVDLFVQRATDAQPAFRLEEGNSYLIAEVCRRLEGLPLAIELAAARVRLFPIETILARLKDGLGTLGAASPQEAARHRSLRAAVAWSYDLLDPEEQQLFRRLSVFRGGWTIEAATGVSGSDAPSDDRALHAIASLRDASLVVRHESLIGSPRFTLLETIREFGSECLDRAGETEPVRRLHASHYREMVVLAGPRLTGREQGAVLDQLAAEHDNIRAALTYLLETTPAEALQMVSHLWRFWQMRGHLSEGSRWVAEALDAAGDGASDRDRASALAALGGLAYWRRDLVEAERCYQAAVVLRRQIGDGRGVADALYDLAFVFDPSLRPPPEDPERTAAGIKIAEEAHDRYSSAGDEPGIAKTEWLLGSVMASRDLDRATALLASSVARFRDLADSFGLGWALHSYGLVLLRSADSDSAMRAFSEALMLFQAAADSSATAMLLDDLAEVAKSEGDALRAARLKGASSARRHLGEAGLVVANAPWLLDDMVTHGLVDPEALKRAWDEGQAFGETDAIAYALRRVGGTVPDRALSVRALGPLIVEQSGEPITDWGGRKAGHRHALGIFGFLLDRGERGVTKDEFIEVLWPDAEVGEADLNFHRTLGGLRSTLARHTGSDAPASVVFGNGRYRLSRSTVGSLDVAEFEQGLDNAAEATNEISAIRGLEAARAMYRGDYLDDCPLYGDSGYVEERRRHLRGRLVDALVDLGRRYEARHEGSLASARYREALSASGEDCPSAVAGLVRLGVPQA